MERVIHICGGYYCGRNWDAVAMRRAMREEIARQGLDGQVEVPELVGGCFGLCLRGPNLVIEPDGIWYAKVQIADIAEIVREHLIGGRIIKRLQDPMHLIWQRKRPTRPTGGPG